MKRTLRRDGKEGRKEGGEGWKEKGWIAGETKGREGGRKGGRDLHELVLKFLHLAWLCSQLHEQVQPERHHGVEDPHERLLCQQLLPEQLVEEQEERE